MLQLFYLITIFLFLLIGVIGNRQHGNFVEAPVEGMVIATPNGKALFLYKGGLLKAFPDFNTFTEMGFNSADIKKMRPEHMHKIPKGAALEAIAPPPTFRADDYMYHNLCEDYARMINDLGIIANPGDFERMGDMFTRVQKTKRIDILALGGSITAGGYFENFARLLREKEQVEVVVHNHGHGATEVIYTLFCIDIEQYQPDLVLIDFSVNDHAHPKLMDALIRKSLMLGNRQPVVAMVNLWVASSCPTTKYLVPGLYYNLPVLNLCPAVDLCYGKGHLPKWRWEEYSKDDGVHPWGKNGVPFIGEVLYAWYARSKEVLLPTSDGPNIIIAHSSDVVQHAAAAASGPGGGGQGTASIPGVSSGFADNRKQRRRALVARAALVLPPPLYGKHIGRCTRCDALADDADGVLRPVGNPVGFKAVTRVKIGFGGFNPDDKDKNTSATKSFRKSWQAETPGDSVSFKFFGTSVSVAMWQRRDGMGVMEAMIDNDREKTALASGFFKGFTWAMEKNNTGRSEVVPLFEGLADKEHLITFRVTDTPANTWVKGHTCQIFALLSASDDPQCKNKVG